MSEAFVYLKHLKHCRPILLPPLICFSWKFNLKTDKSYLTLSASTEKKNMSLIIGQLAELVVLQLTNGILFDQDECFFAINTNCTGQDIQLSCRLC